MKKIIYLIAFVSFLTVTIKADKFEILNNHLLWIKGNVLFVYSISTPGVFAQTDSVNIDGNELKGIIVKDTEIYLYNSNFIYNGELNQAGKFQLTSSFNIPGFNFGTVKAGNSELLFAITNDKKLHAIKVQNGVFSLLNNMLTSTNMEVYAYQNIVILPGSTGLSFYTFDSVFTQKYFQGLVGSSEFYNGRTQNNRLYIRFTSYNGPFSTSNSWAVFNFTNILSPIREYDLIGGCLFDWAFYGNKIVALDGGRRETSYPGNWIYKPGLSIFTQNGTGYTRNFYLELQNSLFNEIHINQLTGIAYIRYSDSHMCVMDLNGNFLVPTAVESNEINVVSEYTLEQNYPNPFNPSTKISFSLPEEKTITLKVFNSLGQEVQLLAEGTHRAGTHTYEWNGNGLTSGTYFYRLQAGDFVSTKKMILIK